MMNTIAVFVATAAAAAVLVIGAPIARADCQTVCYDSGNTGEHCVTTCN
jgi:hypothetical protein